MTDPLPQDLLSQLDNIAELDSQRSPAQIRAAQIRTAKRRPIDFLEVTAPMRGDVLDVSARGMRIETTEPLFVGSRRTFSLSDAMGRRQELSGYIRWSRLARTDRTENGETVPVYVCGVQRCRSIDDPATV